MKDNLQPKVIKEFTSGDTIYIRNGDSKHSRFFLCQFVSFERGIVTGTLIESMTNPSLYKDDVGKEFSCKLNEAALYGKNPIDERTRYHRFKGSGYAIYPKDYMKDSNNSEIIKEHESFGMIRASRINSRNTVLFGSAIDNHNTMTITISRGSVERDLNREWFRGRGQLIEVEMNQSQFCEFITNPNMGSGVPCTIRYIGAERMLNPPYKNERRKYVDEFKAEINNMTVDMEENLAILEGILAKKSINKGDRAEIANLFTTFTRSITDTIPFINKSFNEKMDKTIEEAKGEVESFINSRLTEAGKKAMLGESGAPMLRIGDDEQ